MKFNLRVYEFNNGTEFPIYIFIIKCNGTKNETYFVRSKEQKCNILFSFFSISIKEFRLCFRELSKTGLSSF